MRGSRLCTAVLALGLAASPTIARAVCCPVFPPDSIMFSRGQLNLLVMNEGTVTLIPNIVIAGDATDFALIVPTPTVPTLAEADKDLWSDAAQLTAPVQRNRSNFDSGCNDRIYAVASPEAVDAAGAVDVIRRETVGAFTATILRADDATSLLDWLADNGYEYTGAHAAIFQDFIDEGWVFTAMKLDPNAPGGQIPPDGWNHSVNPVAFEYEVDGFELALPVASIHRNPWMPMRFYVVDDHRMDLPGFTTTYANRLSVGEMRAIEASYPDLAPYLEVGRFFVRLDRLFNENDAMDDVIRLRRAGSDEEVLSFDGGFWGAVPWSMLPLGGVWLGRRRRQGAAQRRVRGDVANLF